MGSQSKGPSGPDLASGVDAAELVEGRALLGHVGDDAVMVVRSGGELFAVGASCTHYGGPLAEGLVADGTVRCPWHHACFDLRTGLASGPALGPIACYAVHEDAGRVRVGDARKPSIAPPAQTPASVVVVGAGAAGAACVETLRRHGYAGPITLLGDEAPGPVDRPNLSKDYLAGTAPEAWVELRGADFYRELDVELRVGDPVTAIDTGAREVRFADGRVSSYGALLIATGAEARRLDVPGGDAPHVHTLRSLADSRAIIAGATSAKRAVVVGASFIGLEVAASLRHRGLEVTVVELAELPLARVLGDAVGRFLRDVHTEHGVDLRLGRTLARIEADRVVLDDGSVVEAGLVVVGIGVRPRTELAEAAGLDVQNGIVVDADMRASAAGVFAAGDVARFPYAGETVRIEHFAVAERQGRRAALAMLGRPVSGVDVPFFWSQHYDVTIGYIGHAERFDAVEVKGDLAARDACVVYRAAGRVLAVATIGRDALSLEVERAMETNDTARLEALLRDA